MKVTVIATGFDYAPDVRPRVPIPTYTPVNVRPAPAPAMPAAGPMLAAAAAQPLAAPEEPERTVADIPFYRKVIAHGRGEDPGGFGPNWSNVDDYDIPTVLRKQMD